MSALAERTARLMERIDQLAALSEEPGRLTRPSLTAAMRRAHDLVGGWMRAAGLQVYEDAAANLIGRLAAADPAARTLVLASHLDSVRDAGRYDGPLGVMIGLAVAEDLAARQVTLPFHLEVIALTDEEGLRFGASLVGSAILSGNFAGDALELTDSSGMSLRRALQDFGGDPAALSGLARDPAGLRGYLEVHIEQGPLLEGEQLPVGIVSAITGIYRGELIWQGMAGHAGTTPMGYRRDAFAGAAAFTLAAEELATATAGLVATVAQVAVEPGASNVISGRTTISLDLRHQDDAVRATALARLKETAQTIADRRNLRLEWRDIHDVPAIAMDAQLRARLADGIAAAGLRVTELASGAGHDAMQFARITPSAMLFVRCRDGISHNPLEHTDAADAAIALAVIDHAVAALIAEG
jgi:allantoate deiminase